MTAKQLIDEAERDETLPKRERGTVKRRLLNFREWLTSEYVDYRGKRGQSPAGVATYIGAIRGFYRANNYPVTFQRRELPKAQAQTERRMLRLDDVKRLLEAAHTQRDKAIIMCLYQSGMDISTLLSLNYSHVKEGLETHEAPLMVRVTRLKTDFRYRTFLGRDAVVYLKNYLLERGSLALGDPLFTTVKEAGGRRLSTNTVQGIFRSLPVRAGLITEEELRHYLINPCGPHALRESFSKIATAAGLNKNLIDYLQGHETGYSGVYSNLPDEELTGAYKDLEPHLTVSSVVVSAWDRLREQARFWGIDLDEFIKQKAQELYATGAGTGGGEYPDLSDPDVVAPLIRDEIRRRLAPTQGSRRSMQRLIGEDELERYLAQGWVFVSALNNGSGKVVVAKP